MSANNHRIEVQAPNRLRVGVTDNVGGWPVEFVECNAPAAITYRGFNHNWTKVSAKPWKLGNRSFAKLENALRALSLQAV